jgi:hypothetical protein
MLYFLFNSTEPYDPLCRRRVTPTIYVRRAGDNILDIHTNLLAHSDTLKMLYGSPNGVPNLYMSPNLPVNFTP